MFNFFSKPKIHSIFHHGGSVSVTSFQIDSDKIDHSDLALSGAKIYYPKHRKDCLITVVGIDCPIDDYSICGAVNRKNRKIIEEVIRIVDEGEEKALKSGEWHLPFVDTISYAKLLVDLRDRGAFQNCVECEDMIALGRLIEISLVHIHFGSSRIVKENLADYHDVFTCIRGRTGMLEEAEHALQCQDGCWFPAAGFIQKLK